MSADPVRMPLRVADRPTRTLEQRIGVRFPALSAGYLRLVSLLRPGSRLRREALNRRDLDAVATGYHPDLEYRDDCLDAAEALASVGLQPL